MVKSETKDRRTELTANIWEGVRRPWLLVTAGTLVLLLYLCALLIQQMPGQLREDPAGAARWILVMSGTYGPWGGVLRTLGLFNVLHNPLLQLLVILVAFVLLVQLGGTIAAVWRLYQLAQRVAQQTAEEQAIKEQTTKEQAEPETTSGEPLPLPATQALFRLRLAVGQSPRALFDAFSTYLTGRFDHIHHLSRPVIAAAVVADSTVAEQADSVATHPDTLPTAADEAAEHVREEQLFAFRDARQALLRPIFFIGLLLALVAVWLILVWGWEVTPPPLAPGAEYRSTSHSLLLQYRLHARQPPLAQAGEGETQAGEGEEAQIQEATLPQLVALIGAEALTMTLDSGARADLGQIHVVNRVGPPALFMRTLTKTAMLSRLGQTQMVPSMGLVFPGPGSEESVVINQVLGLRIVRLAGNEPIQPDQFLIEVYDVRANEVVNRFPVQQATRTELLVDELPVVVEFIPLPSLLIDVTYQPGIWLLWPALLCVLIGLIGYACKPAFVSVQLAPWPIDRTVVVVQSDVAREVEQIGQWLETQTPAAHRAVQ